MSGVRPNNSIESMLYGPTFLVVAVAVDSTVPPSSSTKLEPSQHFVNNLSDVSLCFLMPTVSIAKHKLSLITSEPTVAR